MTGGLLAMDDEKKSAPWPDNPLVQIFGRCFH